MISRKILASDVKKDDEPIVVDSNVVFLCHFDASPPRNVPTTDAGTVVNAGNFRTQVITNSPSSAKFGQGYLQHGGSVTGGASEYVTFPKRFSFGNRNFTIESWHAWNDVFSASGATQYGWELSLDTSNNCGLILSGTRYNGGLTLGINRVNSNVARTITIPGLATLTPSTAYFHVAVVREGASIRIYTNGILRVTENIGTGNINDGTLLKFGNSSNAYQPNCRTDEVRIVMDQVLYTADFTPPTAAFPDPVIE